MTSDIGNKRVKMNFEAANKLKIDFNKLRGKILGSQLQLIGEKIQFSKSVSIYRKEILENRGLHLVTTVDLKQIHLRKGKPNTIMLDLKSACKYADVVTVVNGSESSLSELASHISDSSVSTSSSINSETSYNFITSGSAFEKPSTASSSEIRSNIIPLTEDKEDLFELYDSKDIKNIFCRSIQTNHHSNKFNNITNSLLNQLRGINDHNINSSIRSQSKPRHDITCYQEGNQLTLGEAEIEIYLGEAIALWILTCIEDKTRSLFSFPEAIFGLDYINLQEIFSSFYFRSHEDSEGLLDSLDYFLSTIRNFPEDPREMRENSCVLHVFEMAKWLMSMGIIVFVRWSEVINHSEISSLAVKKLFITMDPSSFIQNAFLDMILRHNPQESDKLTSVLMLVNKMRDTDTIKNILETFSSSGQVKLGLASPILRSKRYLREFVELLNNKIFELIDLMKMVETDQTASTIIDLAKFPNTGYEIKTEVKRLMKKLDGVLNENKGKYKESTFTELQNLIKEKTDIIDQEIDKKGYYVLGKSVGLGKSIIATVFSRELSDLAAKAVSELGGLSTKSSLKNLRLIKELSITFSNDSREISAIIDTVSDTLANIEREVHGILDNYRTDSFVIQNCPTLHRNIMELISEETDPEFQTDILNRITGICTEQIFADFFGLNNVDESKKPNATDILLNSAKLKSLPTEVLSRMRATPDQFCFMSRVILKEAIHGIANDNTVNSILNPLPKLKILSEESTDEEILNYTSNYVSNVKEQENLERQLVIKDLESLECFVKQWSDSGAKLVSSRQNEFNRINDVVVFVEVGHRTSDKINDKIKKDRDKYYFINELAVLGINCLLIQVVVPRRVVADLSLSFSHLLKNYVHPRILNKVISMGQILNNSTEISLSGYYSKLYAKFIDSSKTTMLSAEDLSRTIRGNTETAKVGLQHKGYNKDVYLYTKRASNFAQTYYKEYGYDPLLDEIKDEEMYDLVFRTTKDALLGAKDANAYSLTTDQLKEKQTIYASPDGEKKLEELHKRLGFIDPLRSVIGKSRNKLFNIQLNAMKSEIRSFSKNGDLLLTIEQIVLAKLNSKTGSDKAVVDEDSFECFEIDDDSTKINRLVKKLGAPVTARISSALDRSTFGEDNLHSKYTIQDGLPKEKKDYKEKTHLRIAKFLDRNIEIKKSTQRNFSQKNAIAKEVSMTLLSYVLSSSVFKISTVTKVEQERQSLVVKRHQDTQRIRKHLLIRALGSYYNTEEKSSLAISNGSTLIMATNDPIKDLREISKSLGIVHRKESLRSLIEFSSVLLKSESEFKNVNESTLNVIAYYYALKSNLLFNVFKMCLTYIKNLVDKPLNLPEENGAQNIASMLIIDKNLDSLNFKDEFERSMINSFSKLTCFKQEEYLTDSNHDVPTDEQNPWTELQCKCKIYNNPPVEDILVESCFSDISTNKLNVKLESNNMAYNWQKISGYYVAFMELMNIKYDSKTRFNLSPEAEESVKRRIGVSLTKEERIERSLDQKLRNKQRALEGNMPPIISHIKGFKSLLESTISGTTANLSTNINVIELIKQSSLYRAFESVNTDSYLSNMMFTVVDLLNEEVVFRDMCCAAMVARVAFRNVPNGKYSKTVVSEDLNHLHLIVHIPPKSTDSYLFIVINKVTEESSQFRLDERAIFCLVNAPFGAVMKVMSTLIRSCPEMSGWKQKQWSEFVTEAKSKEVRDLAEKWLFELSNTVSETLFNSSVTANDVIQTIDDESIDLKSNEPLTVIKTIKFMTQVYFPAMIENDKTHNTILQNFRFELVEGISYCCDPESMAKKMIGISRPVACQIHNQFIWVIGAYNSSLSSTTAGDMKYEYFKKGSLIDCTTMVKIKDPEGYMDATFAMHHYFRGLADDRRAVESVFKSFFSFAMKASEATAKHRINADHCLSKFDDEEITKTVNYGKGDVLDFRYDLDDFCDNCKEPFKEYVRSIQLPMIKFKSKAELMSFMKDSINSVLNKTKSDIVTYADPFIQTIIGKIASKSLLAGHISNIRNKKLDESDMSEYANPRAVQQSCTKNYDAKRTAANAQHKMVMKLTNFKQNRYVAANNASNLGVEDLIDLKDRIQNKLKTSDEFDTDELNKISETVDGIILKSNLGSQEKDKISLNMNTIQSLDMGSVLHDVSKLIELQIMSEHTDLVPENQVVPEFESTKGKGETIYSHSKFGRIIDVIKRQSDGVPEKEEPDGKENKLYAPHFQNPYSKRGKIFLRLCVAESKRLKKRQKDEQIKKLVKRGTRLKSQANKELINMARTLEGEFLTEEDERVLISQNDSSQETLRRQMRLIRAAVEDKNILNRSGAFQDLGKLAKSMKRCLLPKQNDEGLTVYSDIKPEMERTDDEIEIKCGILINQLNNYKIVAQSQRVSGLSGGVPGSIISISGIRNNCNNIIKDLLDNHENYLILSLIRAIIIGASMPIHEVFEQNISKLIHMNCFHKLYDVLLNDEPRINSIKVIASITSFGSELTECIDKAIRETLGDSSIGLSAIVFSSILSEDVGITSACLPWIMTMPKLTSAQISKLYIVRTGKLPSKRLITHRSTRVIFNMAESVISDPDTNLFNRATKGILEGTKNSTINLAAKAQFGGDRDLVIMGLQMKLINAAVEKISKAHLKVSEFDMLESAYKKEDCLKTFNNWVQQVEAELHTGIQRLYIESGNSDSTKWGPLQYALGMLNSIKASIAEVSDVNYKLMTAGIFYDLSKKVIVNAELITRVHDILTANQITIRSVKPNASPTEIVGGFDSEDETPVVNELVTKKGKTINYSNLDTEIPGLTDEAKLIIANCVIRDKTYIRSQNHMMQGILHATSTLARDQYARFMAMAIDYYKEADCPLFGFPIPKDYECIYYHSSDDSIHMTKIECNGTTEGLKLGRSIAHQLYITRNLLEAHANIRISAKHVTSNSVAEVYSTSNFNRPVHPFIKTICAILYSANQPTLLEEYLKQHNLMQEGIKQGMSLFELSFSLACKLARDDFIFPPSFQRLQQKPGFGVFFGEFVKLTISNLLDDPMSEPMRKLAQDLESVISKITQYKINENLRKESIEMLKKKELLDTSVDNIEENSKVLLKKVEEHTDVIFTNDEDSLEVEVDWAEECTIDTTIDATTKKITLQEALNVGLYLGISKEVAQSSWMKESNKNHSLISNPCNRPTTVQQLSTIINTKRSLMSDIQLDKSKEDILLEGLFAMRKGTNERTFRLKLFQSLKDQDPNSAASLHPVKAMRNSRHSIAGSFMHSSRYIKGNYVNTDSNVKMMSLKDISSAIVVSMEEFSDDLESLEYKSKTINQVLKTYTNSEHQMRSEEDSIKYFNPLRSYSTTVSKLDMTEGAKDKRSEIYTMYALFTRANLLLDNGVNFNYIELKEHILNLRNISEWLFQTVIGCSVLSRMLLENKDIKDIEEYKRFFVAVIIDAQNNCWMNLFENIQTRVRTTPYLEKRKVDKYLKTEEGSDFLFLSRKAAMMIIEDDQISDYIKISHVKNRGLLNTADSDLARISDYISKLESVLKFSKGFKGSIVHKVKDTQTYGTNRSVVTLGILPGYEGKIGTKAKDPFLSIDKQSSSLEAELDLRTYTTFLSAFELEKEAQNRQNEILTDLLVKTEQFSVSEDMKKTCRIFLNFLKHSQLIGDTKTEKLSYRTTSSNGEITSIYVIDRTNENISEYSYLWILNEKRKFKILAGGPRHKFTDMFISACSRVGWVPRYVFNALEVVDAKFDRKSHAIPVLFFNNKIQTINVPNSKNNYLKENYVGKARWISVRPPSQEESFNLTEDVQHSNLIMRYDQHKKLKIMKRIRAQENSHYLSEYAIGEEPDSLGAIGLINTDSIRAEILPLSNIKNDLILKFLSQLGIVNAKNLKKLLVGKGKTSVPKSSESSMIEAGPLTLSKFVSSGRLDKIEQQQSGRIFIKLNSSKFSKTHTPLQQFVNFINLSGTTSIIDSNHIHAFLTTTLLKKMNLFRDTRSCLQINTPISVIKDRLFEYISNTSTQQSRMLRIGNSGVSIIRNVEEESWSSNPIRTYYITGDIHAKRNKCVEPVKKILSNFGIHVIKIEFRTTKPHGTYVTKWSGKLETEVLDIDATICAAFSLSFIKLGVTDENKNKMLRAAVGLSVAMGRDPKIPSDLDGIASEENFLPEDYENEEDINNAIKLAEGELPEEDDMISDEEHTPAEDEIIHEVIELVSREERITKQLNDNLLEVIEEEKDYENGVTKAVRKWKLDNPDAPEEDIDIVEDWQIRSETVELDYY